MHIFKWKLKEKDGISIVGGIVGELTAYFITIFDWINKY